MWGKDRGPPSPRNDGARTPRGKRGRAQAKQQRRRYSRSARPSARGANHSGQKQYAALPGWKSRDLADEFSRHLVDLVRVHHPEAFDGGA
jgi:hypothetical protein